MGLATRLACIVPYVRNSAARSGYRLAPGAMDDVIQNTYLAIWNKLGTYRGDARLETWACGFGFYELKRWAARRHRNREKLAELGEEPLAQASQPDDAPRILNAALEHLGPPAEDVIRLKHFEELSFRAIGLRLALSPNTAKALYYRGLAKLKERLQGLEEGLVG